MLGLQHSNSSQAWDILELDQPIPPCMYTVRTVHYTCKKECVLIYESINCNSYTCCKASRHQTLVRCVITHVHTRNIQLPTSNHTLKPSTQQACKNSKLQKWAPVAKKWDLGCARLVLHSCEQAAFMDAMLGENLFTVHSLVELKTATLLVEASVCNFCM